MAGVAFKLGHSCISCSSCRFAHAGSCIWGPAGPWEVLHMNTHTTLAALCYPDRQHSAQLWQNRAAVHFHTFLWPAPWTQIDAPRPKTLTGFPYRHHTSQNTPYTHLTCRQTPHLSRCPLAAPSDYIKKSSPLSGLSWPGYTKCHCQGQLVHGCSYCWGFNYTHMRNL